MKKETLLVKTEGINEEGDFVSLQEGMNLARIWPWTCSSIFGCVPIVVIRNMVFFFFWLCSDFLIRNKVFILFILVS
ncbi:hypothetical protein LINPERPRIM_LOCUS43660 [Linum perenne]